MAIESKVEQIPQPPGHNVRWVFAENQLGGLSLPYTTVENNRYLLAQVDGLEVAVEVFAFSPTEPPASGFWSGIAQRVHSHLSPVEKLPATRLKIEPQIDFADAQRGLHTPLSALHPYVVMEDGTRYGIGVFVPREWVGQWSEPRERNEGGLFALNKIGEQVTEVYRQKKGVALLIRLNGDTPLVEQQRGSSIKGLAPSRQEMLIGIPESIDDDTIPHAVAIVSHRQVVHANNSSTPDLGEKQTERADVSDLEFHVVAERGMEENATLDNRGLVEVIVVRCVEDEVIERITKPAIVSSYPFDSLPATDSPTRSLSYGGDLKGSQYLGVPDSTLKGETRFANERRKKVSVQTVRDIQPVARFKLALVGSGGPIRTSMAEAPEPVPQS